MTDADAGRTKCRNVKFRILRRIRVEFNPVVTIVSAVIIWAFVFYCLRWTDQAKDAIPTWKNWITLTWTWLYIGCEDIWTIFILFILFSKYSNVKLGRPNDKPEFSDASYFTMLFAAGIGVGLFYYGVAEPIYHYEPSHNKPYANRYQERYVWFEILPIYFPVYLFVSDPLTTSIEMSLATFSFIHVLALYNTDRHTIVASDV